MHSPVCSFCSFFSPMETLTSAMSSVTFQIHSASGSELWKYLQMREKQKKILFGLHCTGKWLANWLCDRKAKQLSKDATCWHWISPMLCSWEFTMFSFINLRRMGFFSHQTKLSDRWALVNTGLRLEGNIPCCYFNILLSLLLEFYLGLGSPPEIKGKNVCVLGMSENSIIWIWQQFHQQAQSRAKQEWRRACTPGFPPPTQFLLNTRQVPLLKKTVHLGGGGNLVLQIFLFFQTDLSRVCKNLRLSSNPGCVKGWFPLVLYIYIKHRGVDRGQLTASFLAVSKTCTYSSLPSVGHRNIL